MCITQSVEEISDAFKGLPTFRDRIGSAPWKNLISCTRNISRTFDRKWKSSVWKPVFAESLFIYRHRNERTWNGCEQVFFPAGHFLAWIHLGQPIWVDNIVYVKIYLRSSLQSFELKLNLLHLLWKKPRKKSNLGASSRLWFCGPFDNLVRGYNMLFMYELNQNWKAK